MLRELWRRQRHVAMQSLGRYATVRLSWTPPVAIQPLSEPAPETITFHDFYVRAEEIRDESIYVRGWRYVCEDIELERVDTLGRTI